MKEKKEIIKITMSVLTKVVIRSVVGVLTVGMLGCGGLFPSTSSISNTPNLHKAEDLEYKRNENLPHNPIRLQAKADAESDARHDVNLPAYFGAGMSAPFAAAMCGMTSFCLLELSTGYERDYRSCTGASVGAGAIFSMLIGYYTRPANPPPERLIGKSPEYVKFYAEAYRSKMRSYRIQSVAAGSAAGTVILSVTAAYFFLYTL